MATTRNVYRNFGETCLRHPLGNRQGCGYNIKMVVGWEVVCYVLLCCVILCCIIWTCGVTVSKHSDLYWVHYVPPALLERFKSFDLGWNQNPPDWSRLGLYPCRSEVTDSCAAKADTHLTPVPPLPRTSSARQGRVHVLFGSYAEDILLKYHRVTGLYNVKLVLVIVNIYNSQTCVYLSVFLSVCLSIAPCSPKRRVIKKTVV